jgi:ferredoxin, 2Fe-2S
VYVVDVVAGRTVMEGAKQALIAGIDADCGGGCSCGTCHVYTDPAWQERGGGRNLIEDATIEFADNVLSNSRLGCQIKVTDELD